jgi:hypothetical protein
VTTAGQTWHCATCSPSGAVPIGNGWIDFFKTARHEKASRRDLPGDAKSGLDVRFGLRQAAKSTIQTAKIVGILTYPKTLRRDLLGDREGV